MKTKIYLAKKSFLPFSITSVLCIMIFMSTIFIGCEKKQTIIDPCQFLVCNYGGVCENGNCKCSAGFEGVDCSTKSRDKFLGTWMLTTYINVDSFGNNPMIYETFNPISVSISNGINDDEIIISYIQYLDFLWSFNAINDLVCKVDKNSLRVIDQRFLSTQSNYYPLPSNPYPWQDFNSTPTPNFSFSAIRHGLLNIAPTQYLIYRFSK
jgi:hypothetical protein